jgi:hypothetical protein
MFQRRTAHGIPKVLPRVTGVVNLTAILLALGCPQRTSLREGRGRGSPVPNPDQVPVPYVTILLVVKVPARNGGNVHAIAAPVTLSTSDCNRRAQLAMVPSAGEPQ